MGKRERLQRSILLEWKYISFSFVNKVWILDWPRNGELSISRFTVPFYQLLVELFSLHMNVGI